jgi:hypothetical protein
MQMNSGDPRNDAVTSAPASHSSPELVRPPSAVATAPPALTELCRICEQLVSQEEFSEHSKYCAVLSAAATKSSETDDRMRKVITSLDQKVDELKRSQTMPTVDKDAVRKDIDLLSAIRVVLTGAVAMMIDAPEIEATYAELKIQLKEIGEMVDSDSPSAPIITPLLERAGALVKDKYGAYAQVTRVLSPQLLASLRPAHSDQNSRRLSLDLNPEKKRHSYRDFEMLQPISKGAYGRVYLARKKRTGDVFAIKVLRKEGMQGSQLEHIRAERNILAVTAQQENPFVVKMYYSFQSSKNLYLVMEYMPGGDLHALLKNLDSFSEDMTKFYLCEVRISIPSHIFLLPN